jgi:hypothetical protein
MAGMVFTAGSTMQKWPIPTAFVFVRRWPNGPVLRSLVDKGGHFAMPELGGGTYEVAVCANGWNPWRGTVRLHRGAAPDALTFPLELGQ